MIRLARRLRDDDGGIGMVELLVSMMLSAILLALVGTMFVNVARATTTADTTRQAATVAGTIANDLARTIRFAVQNRVQGQLALDPAVVAGFPASVTVYSLVDTSAASPVPEKVRYSVVGGEVVSERWAAAVSGGYYTFASGSPSSSRSLGGAVVAPTGGENPLFTYLDGTGAAIVPGAQGLTAAQRAAVAAIRISVRIQAPGTRAAPVVLENRVGMPNLGYAGGTG